MSEGRRLRPGLEPLEERRVPVGFFEGTPSAPVLLALNGLAGGVGVFRAKAGAVVFEAYGKISPIGQTTITGILRVRGGVEEGSLMLQSPRYTLPLRVGGPAPTAGGSALGFQIVNGMGVPSGSTYEFIREQGGGMVNVTLATGPGRFPVTLLFRSGSAAKSL